ncbi:hypothetical protein HYFRA_00007701 [Hymenoscyphus fraxineus]|uniref:Uncharacterized protein n=1 Tax=Hymenoscyphus fraxineus TaxID=746836 RepID=A0A9N9KM26_9HELO|nr:hypothetical protein HYFRA_00007701 [Hymenoscyphus fraxineus]
MPYYAVCPMFLNSSPLSTWSISSIVCMNCNFSLRLYHHGFLRRIFPIIEPSSPVEPGAQLHPGSFDAFACPIDHEASCAFLHLLADRTRSSQLTLRSHPRSIVSI